MPEESKQYQVLGLQEIAEMLEVEKRTPHAWQYRKLLPPPDYDSVNGLRAWKRETIVRWAAKTGRLPASGVLNDEAAKRRYVKSDTDEERSRGGREAKAENRKKLEAAGMI